VQITYSIGTANCTAVLQFVIKILTFVPTGDVVENTKTYFEFYFVLLAVHRVLVFKLSPCSKCNLFLFG